MKFLHCENCGNKIQVNSYKSKRTDWKIFRFKYFKKYYNKFKKLKPTKIDIVRLIVSRKYFIKRREQLSPYNYSTKVELKNFYKLITDPRQKEHYENLI
tara:strand:+ start:616 stop:912 length:297 start_codon:yes stop_codon:yes gene_type:complete